MLESLHSETLSEIHKTILEENIKLGSSQSFLIKELTEENFMNVNNM